MSDDKMTIDYSDRSQHRLIAKMPEFHSKYGLWIINASEHVKSGPDGYSICLERRFDFYSISHLIDGRGRLWLKDSGECDIHVGDLVVITPGTYNRYGGCELPYVEDAIRFCGPLADMMAASGIITSGVYKLGAERSLLPIARMINDPGRDAQIRANLELQTLLTNLYFKSRETVRNDVIEELTLQIQNDLRHWWTVDELAGMASVSKDVLRRCFIEHTGMLPKLYIEETKLRAACDMLLAANLSIREIAERLGYTDPYHFSRRFKIRMGTAPENYRLQYCDHAGR